VKLGFRVENARREIVTITWGNRHRRVRLHVADGRGSVAFVPPTSGDVSVRISVKGLDGTTVKDATSFSVLSRPPVIRILSAPRVAVVGQPVRIVFQLAHGRRASVRVSTKSGIVLRRDYVLHDHVGILKWTPDAPGRADVLLSVQGHQGQSARASLRLQVKPFAVVAPPAVQILHVPEQILVGRPATFTLAAQNCTTVTARVRGNDAEAPAWHFPCPAERASFDWTPQVAGTYTLTVVARSAEDLTASQTVRLHVRESKGTSP
jgi:hypothetical protein